MAEFIDLIIAAAKEHWIKVVTAAAFTLAGVLIGKRRALAQWRKKEFLHRINFSLNMIRDGKLMIRTILEKSCEEVFLNKAASDAIDVAARNTTEQNPILPLPKDEYWYYLNSVLNELSEKFSEGHIRRDMGLPVTSENYLICLTCERSGPVRTRKVRAMVIQKKLLDNLPKERPKLSAESHITRWETLNILAAQWKSAPHQFLDVEISV